MVVCQWLTSRSDVPAAGAANWVAEGLLEALDVGVGGAGAAVGADLLFVGADFQESLTHLLCGELMVDDCAGFVGSLTVIDGVSDGGFCGA